MSLPCLIFGILEYSPEIKSKQRDNSLTAKQFWKRSVYQQRDVIFHEGIVISIPFKRTAAYLTGAREKQGCSVNNAHGRKNGLIKSAKEMKESLVFGDGG